MPTKTFYNLSEDKKRAIIESSKMEFSNQLYHKTSINNIIKTSGISRGSFYLYFDSKEDLYSYIQLQYKDLIINEFKTILKKNNGDLIDTYSDIFDSVICLLNNQRYPNLFKNFFLNMRRVYDNREGFKETSHELEDALFSILDNVDTSLLNKSDNNSLITINHILITLLLHSLIEMFLLNISSKEAKEEFKTELLFIKEGIYK